MKEFRFAFQKSIPILIGFFPLGIAYGILMQEAGYSALWSYLTSALVYAGSLQFLMLNFFASSVPFFTVAVMALLLNSRHIFYGLSFLERFKKMGKWRYFLIFGLTDECYSLLCAYEPDEGLSEKKVFVFTSLLLWIYWSVFSMLGGLVGVLIPFDTTGIDFALTALFVVILVDKLRENKKRLPAWIALGSSLVSMLIFGRENFILPALLLTVAVLLLFTKKTEGGREA